MSARPRGTRLVIDASVASSAAETEHPVSSLCRNFLKAVLDSAVQFQVVMTHDILMEWQRHRSRYSLRWQKTMTAKRRVVTQEIPRHEALRRKMVTAEMLKDVHLLEAALATDKRIASRDDTARGFYGGIPEVRMVLWINPALEEEGAVEWLDQGAKLETFRLLAPAPR
jgi:hypothetical protein